MSSVYISGPMTGYDGYNYAAFNELAANLRETGYAVLNPAENFGGETDRPRPDYMRLDVAHVLESDCVMVLPGWETSRGARLEVTVALEIGLSVYDTEWNEITAEARCFLDNVVQQIGRRVVAEDREALEMLAAYDRGEVRVVDALTGGQKGRKPARFDLIPVGPLWKVAELYGKGAEKYDERNWEKGYAWSLSYAALQRHLNQFWGGESIDAETQCHHLASAIFHCMALMEYEAKGKGTDDRA